MPGLMKSIIHYVTGLGGGGISNRSENYLDHKKEIQVLVRYFVWWLYTSKVDGWWP